MSTQYYAYILANKTHTALYVGVTNNPVRRVWEHKEKQIKGFTNKYNIDQLVWFETYEEVEAAIKREKQLKGGSRKNKIKFIEKNNPTWIDLYSNIVQ